MSALLLGFHPACFLSRCVNMQGDGIVQVLLNGDRVIARLPITVFVECVSPFLIRDYAAECALKDEPALK